MKNPDVSRGAAFGDIDNDGDTDVVVANDSGPIRLLINHVGSAQTLGRGESVGANAVPRQARDALSMPKGATWLAREWVLFARPGPTLWRRARADGSYASANDPRVLVGLGDTATIVKVRVEWPGGNAEEWTDVPVDRYTDAEGRRRPVRAAIVVSVVVLSAVSCVSRNEPKTADRRTLQAVALPDLSRLEESVQVQLRERYAALTAKQTDPATHDGRPRDRIR